MQTTTAATDETKSSRGKTRRFVAVGVSFPKPLIKRIDNERGDVGRSRHVIKIVQAHYRDLDKNGGSAADVSSTRDSKRSIPRQRSKSRPDTGSSEDDQPINSLNQRSNG